MEIKKCPNPECKNVCELKSGHHTGSWVMCMKCEYCGPQVLPSAKFQYELERDAEAIRLHNLICEGNTNAEHWKNEWLRLANLDRHPDQETSSSDTK